MPFGHGTQLLEIWLELQDMIWSIVDSLKNVKGFVGDDEHIGS